MSLEWNISILIWPKYFNFWKIRGFFILIYFILQTCYEDQNCSEFHKDHYSTNCNPNQTKQEVQTSGWQTGGGGWEYLINLPLPDHGSQITDHRLQNLHETPSGWLLRNTTFTDFWESGGGQLSRSSQSYPEPSMSRSSHLYHCFKQTKWI